MRNITITRSIHNTIHIVGRASCLIFNEETANEAIFSIGINHITSVQDIYTIIQEKLLDQNSKDLWIILNLKPTIMFGTTPYPI